MGLLSVANPSVARQQGPTPPKPINPSGWLGNLEYPAASLRNGEQGTVAFELAIDALGRVTDCRITASSGFVALDRQTCMIAHRAPFVPAHDASGRALSGTFASHLRWALPKQELLPVANWLSAGIMRLDAEGNMAACDEEHTGPVPERIAHPCAVFRPGKRHALMAAIGAGTGKPQTLVTETAMAFDDAPEIRMGYMTPGHRLAVRAQVGFDVTETGKVEKCHRVPTGQEGIFNQFPTVCDFEFGPFVPPTDSAGTPRRVRATYTVAISVVE